MNIMRTFVTVGLVSGSFLLSSKSAAQTPTSVDNTKLIRYSKVLLRIEPARQKALLEIELLIGNKGVPQLQCNETNTLTRLSDKAKNIATNYCSCAEKIVKENGFTIDQFNQITVALQNNDALKKEIYKTIRFS